MRPRHGSPPHAGQAPIALGGGKGVGKMSVATSARGLGRAVSCAALAIVFGTADTRADVAPYGSGMILRGAMTEHDAELLEARLPHNGTLFLASPGGSLAAGLRIAALTQARQVSVVVEGDCASACSLPFFAATRRVMKPGTRIGVHSSSKLGGREDDETLAMTARVVRILARHGVPQTVVAGMVTATPDKVYWLNDSELAQLRAERVAAAPETAGPCRTYKIEAPAGFGRIRAAPSLDASVVEALTNGSRVESCGESRADGRGVAWLNVTAHHRDVAGHVLVAKGWISLQVLAR